MSFARTCFILLFLTFTTAALAQDVAGALARMDSTAATFKAMSANVAMQQYTKLLDDKSTQSGTLEMQRIKNGQIRAILNFPEEQTLAFTGKNVTIYYPKTGETQTYKASNLGSALNQFLLLGFGSSGRELKLSYNISPDGTETIGGQSTVKLILTPKDPRVAEKLPKAELWIPDNAGYPVQQQFWEPTSGNYRLLTYSNIRINPPINGALEFKPPTNSKKSR